MLSDPTAPYQKWLVSGGYNEPHVICIQLSHSEMGAPIRYTDYLTPERKITVTHQSGTQYDYYYTPNLVERPALDGIPQEFSFTVPVVDGRFSTDYKPGLYKWLCQMSRDAMDEKVIIRYREYLATQLDTPLQNLITYRLGEWEASPEGLVL